MFRYFSFLKQARAKLSQERFERYEGSTYYADIDLDGGPRHGLNA